MDMANLGRNITSGNPGRTLTETSDRQYQALLLDPHDYEYPNMAEITSRNTDVSMPTNLPAQSHTDNAREYLELIDDSNGQENVAMTTVGGPEYDDIAGPSIHTFTDNDMVLTDNQTYFPANSVQYENI